MLMKKQGYIYENNEEETFVPVLFGWKGQMMEKLFKNVLEFQM